MRTLLHFYAGFLGVVIVTGVLIFIGAWLMNGRLLVPPIVPLAVIVILWFGAHLAFIAEARYMSPVAPITVVIAVAAWGTAYRRMRNKQSNALVFGNARDRHAMVQALEREGMATPLDLSNPGWRAEKVIEGTSQICSSTSLHVPGQSCGLDPENHSWPAYYVRALRNTVIDVDSGLLFAQERVIAQSGSGTRAARDAAFVSGATVRVTQATPQSFTGPVAPLGDVHHHYHVMLETLPRILLALKADSNTTFVTSTSIHPRYREVLDAWAVRVQTMEPGTLLSPDTVVLVDQPELFWPRPSDIDALRAAFRLSETQGDATDQIYISRRKVARAIEGEEELEKQMRDRGFRPVLLEELSIFEQAALFARSSVVIAPHGAGLSGIAFMPQGSKVFEISSGVAFENCYRRIAAVCNLDYNLLLVEGRSGAEFGTAKSILGALDQIQI
jgi:hypothetical protein